MTTRLREVMTSDPVALEESATIEDAARLMRDRNIGDVVVTSGGKVVGIVTDRDIVVRAIADGRDGSAGLSSIYSRDPETLGVDDSVAHATRAMREHGVRRLPIVEDGLLVGIVALGDLAEEMDPESVLGEISAAPPNS